MKRLWLIVAGVCVVVAALVLVFILFDTRSVGDREEVAEAPAEDSSSRKDVGPWFPMTAAPEMTAPEETVDDLLSEMEFGQIAFNTPEYINLKGTTEVTLVLSLAETVEQLKRSIEAEGQRVGASIRVSDRMEARLSGSKFQITAITPRVQAVSRQQRTHWRWEVHPKEVGKHNLHLTLAAILDINGNSAPRTIQTFSEVIEVRVTASQRVGNFFKNNWQWLWAAVLVPITGWLLRRKRSDNERSG